jgi:hypothetical protein
MKDLARGKIHTENRQGGMQQGTQYLREPLSCNQF